jgi:hypothetical protein
VSLGVVEKRGMGHRAPNEEHLGMVEKTADISGIRIAFTVGNSQAMRCDINIDEL